MSFTKKTIKDINVKGKTILLRADFNVPLDKNGKISSYYRLEQALPTIEYLISQDCKVIICSHLGRPDGKRDLSLSLAPVAKQLGKYIKNQVYFIGDCVGKAVNSAVSNLKPKEVLVLENLRYYKEEENNDKEFAKQLASLADIFVEDGFGVVHRAHASTEGVTKYLPSVAGLLLAKEVKALTSVITDPKKPLMAIVGGAKIADKIDILRKFIKLADIVVIGGAMANTFLRAKGINIARSLSEPADVPLAHDILELAEAESSKRQFTFYVPQDSVVAKKIDKTAHTRIVDWDSRVFATLENYPKLPPKSASRLEADDIILDIGPYSGAFIAGSMQLVKTVIWNGTMGVTETPSINGPIGPFAHGTEIVIEALMGDFGNRPYSLIGGGDTSAYIEDRGLVNCFNHVSTGGGASLDMLAGKKLPGIEALMDK